MLDRHFKPKHTSMLLHKLMHKPVTAYLRAPRNADLAKLIMRLAVGAVFIYHGKMKLFGMSVPMGGGEAVSNLSKTVGFFKMLHIPMPELMAPFIGGLEFFGGILLILGVAVRLLGFLSVCNMAVAILAAKGLSIWGKIELEMMLLASSLGLLLSGSGAYAVDAWLMKKGAGEHASSMPMAAPKA